MSEQAKRDVGRPRTGRERQAITLTLSNEVIAFLSQLSAGDRSKFVDDWLRQHPDIAVSKEKDHDA